LLMPMLWGDRGGAAGGAALRAELKTSKAGMNQFAENLKRKLPSGKEVGLRRLIAFTDRSGGGDMSLASQKISERRRKRYRWTAQLDTLLEQGYKSPIAIRKAMIKRICSLTGWPRQACWDRARKLGFSQKRTSPFKRWSEDEEEILMRFVGIKNIRDIAKLLKRTEDSLRAKLKTIVIGNRTGVSARIREGTTRKELAAILHRSPQTIQRWIDNGWLRVRYDGKQRSDDTVRITDEDFRAFYKKHPWEIPFYTLKAEGLEYFFSVMIDIRNSQTFHPDPVEREKKKLIQEAKCVDEENA
jgi:hypothetical protein